MKFSICSNRAMDDSPTDRRYEVAAALLLQRLNLAHDSRDLSLVSKVLAGIGPVDTHPVPLTAADIRFHIKFAIGQAPAGVIQQLRQGSYEKREIALNQLSDLVLARFEKLQVWAPPPIGGGSSPPSYRESREREARIQSDTVESIAQSTEMRR